MLEAALFVGVIVILVFSILLTQTQKLLTTNEQVAFKHHVRPVEIAFGGLAILPSMVKSVLYFTGLIQVDGDVFFVGMMAWLVLLTVLLSVVLTLRFKKLQFNQRFSMRYLARMGLLVLLVVTLLGFLQYCDQKLF